MTTAAHLTPRANPTTGAITLRLSTSGYPPATSILIYRRIIGDDTLTPVILPAAWAESTGGIRPIIAQASFDDTTAPLDTPVEYLAAIDGGEPLLVSDAVTLANPGGWWLGDPLRPHLNLLLVLRRFITACDGLRAVFLGHLGAEGREAVSTLTAVTGRGDRIHGTQPMRWPTSDVIMVTKELEDAEALHALLDPGGALLLRAPASPDYGFISRFVSVRQVSSERVASDARRAWRRHQLTYEVVTQPAGSASAVVGTSWGDLCDVYATFAAMVAAGDLSWTSVAGGVVTGVYPVAYRTHAEVTATWATYAALTAAGLSYTDLVTGV